MLCSWFSRNSESGGCVLVVYVLPQTCNLKNYSYFKNYVQSDPLGSFFRINDDYITFVEKDRIPVFDIAFGSAYSRLLT